MEGSSDTSDVSLSCLFSSFESEDWEDSHSAEDDTGTVEPYQFEPEVTDNEDPSDPGASAGELSDEERLGNTNW